MKEEQTDFLDDFDTDTDVMTAPPAVTTQEPQTDSGQPRNPDGTFAKTQAEKDAAELVQQGVKPEAQPAPGAEPPSAEPEDVKGLRAALKAEREKRQLTEAQLAKLQPPAGTAPQSQTQPPKGPEFVPPQIDPEDPQTYAHAIHSMRMQQSQFFAVQQSSEAEVAEAWAAFDAACEAQPGGPASIYSQTLVNHPHPMGEVLKWHRQQKDLQLLQEAGGLEKLRERWLAEAQATHGAQPAPAAGVAPAAQRPTPPPSLANGGAGAHADPGISSEDDDFNGLFEGARKPRKR